METFIQRIRDRKVRIGILGLGYVGLPLASTFIRAGFKVTGCDPDRLKIQALQEGKSYLETVSDSVVSGWTQEMFACTSQPESDVMYACDVLIACVPTPLTSHREPDLSYVRRVAGDIRSIVGGRGDNQPVLAVLESTSYPGTTMEIFSPIVSINTDNVLVAYSPEREDPKNPVYSTGDIPRVVGADDEVSLRAAVALYEQIVPTVFAASTTKVAEASKILENTFRAVNISLVNELKVVFDRMGIDIWEVIAAAKTKPFGFMPFYPSSGYGGHCILPDPIYLNWKAKHLDVISHFIDKAVEVNSQMIKYVFTKIQQGLNDEGKSIKGSKICVLGVAYKPEVNDLRESPALSLIPLLMEWGAQVDYFDPLCPIIRNITRDGGDIRSVQITTSKDWENFDAVVLITNHSCFNYREIAEHATLIVDTRNAFYGYDVKNSYLKA